MACSECKKVRAESEAQIAALQLERDALREALKLARTRMAHRIGCTTINPTEEWAEKGSINVDDCHCEISVIDAALSTPASEESKCPRCGSHLRHITFPIGASLPYRSCDDAWHTASEEPARKP